MTDQWPELDAATQMRAKRAAKIAATVRIQLRRSLPEVGDRDLLGMIAARITDRLLHEEAKTKRLGVVRLQIGAAVEQPRGAGGPSVQTVHSGNELEIPVDGLDGEGAKANLDTLAASSSDTSQVTTRVGPRVNTPNPDGNGVAVFIADALGGNQTTPGSEPEVTITAGNAPPIIERVAVVAGDVTSIQLGAAVEAPRPATGTGEPPA